MTRQTDTAADQAAWDRDIALLREVTDRLLDRVHGVQDGSGSQTLRETLGQHSPDELVTMLVGAAMRENEHRVFCQHIADERNALAEQVRSLQSG